MRKILYVGIFSASNIGDLVISNQIYKFLKNKNNVSIDCMDFGTLKKTNCANDEISIHENCTINKKIKNILPKSNIIRRIHSKFSELSALSDNCKLYKEYKDIVDEYDLVCIGGGNLLMSISNNYWAIKMNNLVKIAKNKNKKIFVMSIGAGPILLNKSQKLFKETLELVDYITVRDEYSKYILKNKLQISKKIEISGDPALLLNYKNDIEHKENRDNTNIAISVMPFGKQSFPNLPHYKTYGYYLDMYKNLIEYFYNRNANYIFYLFSTEWSDYNTVLELQTHILKNSKYITERNLKVEYIKSLSDLLKFYKRQDLLIGTRMHSLIIGFTQLLPIVAISWQNKVEGFMKQINLLQYCHQLNMVNENIGRIHEDAQQLLICNTQNNRDELINLKKRYDSINTYYIESSAD